MNNHVCGGRPIGCYCHCCLHQEVNGVQRWCQTFSFSQQNDMSFMHTQPQIKYLKAFQVLFWPIRFKYPLATGVFLTEDPCWMIPRSHAVAAGSSGSDSWTSSLPPEQHRWNPDNVRAVIHLLVYYHKELLFNWSMILINSFNLKHEELRSFINCRSSHTKNKFTE